MLEKTQIENLIDIERQYGAHNYHPLPVVLDRGEGIFLYDVEGKKYFDFLSAYSCVNQGHCHPRIVEAFTTQAKRLTITSRAFYNDQLGRAEKYVCTLFDYQKSLFMNSGAEANETALKLARKWGYTKKNIPANQAVIVVAKGNFHGRTITAISASTDPLSRNGFGPYTLGFEVVPYNDISALEKALTNPHVCGFWIEPIQGEAGVYVPDQGYLTEAARLCKKYQVLLMMDEIQTGLGRTGRMLASDYENVRPDILILGKALSGGMLPVSVVLADDEIMLVIRPGEHGSTYGGNPLAAAVVQTALQVIVDEGLADNAERMGVIFRQRMEEIKHKYDLIREIRGKGLLNAVSMDDSMEKDIAWRVCLQMASYGLLAKPTHGNVIRLSPPLIITQEQVEQACAIIDQAVGDIQKTK